MFLGIDIGTSVTKAAAFDPQGRLLAVETRRTRLSTPQPGWFEQDLDEVLASVATVTAAVAARAGNPDAIGLTGQGDGVWLVDESGRPVRPAISWMDSRAAPILQEWHRNGTVEAAFARTGNIMFPGCAATILAWLDQHEPQSLARAATAGYCKDVVMQRLTGIRATDASDASLPFAHPHTGDYDSQVLAACGLAAHTRLLAPIVRPLPRGELTAEAAALLGVPAGTPVTSGPFDLPAGAMGSGVTRVGDGHLIIGTTLACQVLADTVDTGGEATGMTLATGTPGRWLRAMPAMVGTAALDWVLNLVGTGHDQLDALLADSPPGARGVACLPFFSPAGERAPFLDPNARAGFDNLTVQTSRADLVRATCESVAFAARHCFEAAGLSGEVAVCGGGTNSGAWLQVFADALDRPLRLAPQPETGARGAVLAAAAAVGADIDAQAWTAGTAVVTPEATRVRQYADRYGQYRSRVDIARNIWKDRP